MANEEINALREENARLLNGEAVQSLAKSNDSLFKETKRLHARELKHREEIDRLREENARLQAKLAQYDPTADIEYHPVVVNLRKENARLAGELRQGPPSTPWR